MLYRPEAFEPLTGAVWNAARVRDAIRAIADDAASAYDPKRLWPDLDEWDGGGAELPLTTLYAGASGVALALDRLRRRGLAEPALDLEAAATRAVEAWREQPDFPERREPPVRTHGSLYFGETGPLLVASLLAPSRDVADSLYGRVRVNVENETNELMNGAPGTMIAARAMLEWTGEPRWADIWRASADVLWERRREDGLWTSPPYGGGIGAAHGVGTNTAILCAGGELFPAERREPLLRSTADALRRYAVVEDGLANWPLTGEEHPNLVGWDGQIRLQWCHGAAGVVASASEYLDEDLLLAGAELIWRAGPPGMEKGPGICHGTAGSGYAFLKTFARTGDERWLERAHLFAVHALGQVDRWRERRGSGRFSLWTGDVGAALLASDCLDARSSVPVVEVL